MKSLPRTVQTLASVLGVSVALLSSGSSSAFEMAPFRFVEAKSIQNARVEPQLEITIEFMCNEEFVQVVRYETTNPKTQVAEIALGALVREQPFSSCRMEKKTLTVPAGHSYSGREFKTFKIQAKQAS